MGEGFLVEKLVTSSISYRGRLYSVRKDVVELPDGRLTEREIVAHPGAVAIVPMIEDRIIMIRQFRQATGKTMYEIPAGTMREGEEPDNCAMRELLEETGYLARTLSQVFHCYMAPGYSTEIVYFYLATNLDQVRRSTDPDEFIEICPMTVRTALQMIASNEIEDAKTMCGILMLLQRKILKD